MNTLDDAAQRVGPVLQATPVAQIFISAIEEDNDDVVVRDEGAYLRVLVPDVCRLSRATVEAASGTAIQFPGELEVIMSSFAGLMRMNDQGAVWWLAGEREPEP